MNSKTLIEFSLNSIRASLVEWQRFSGILLAKHQIGEAVTLWHFQAGAKGEIKCPPPPTLYEIFKHCYCLPYPIKSFLAVLLQT